MQMITPSSLVRQPSWAELVDCIDAGHRFQRPELKDSFLGGDPATLLSRATFIKGYGAGVKSVTINPDNATRGLNTVQGAMLVFDPDTSSISAVVNSKLITPWKTVADSLLGARYLAPRAPTRLLIVGAGAIAANLIDGYLSMFPTIACVSIWARNRDRAEILAQTFDGRNVTVEAAVSLEEACSEADIIAAATLATEPLIRGAWVKKGAHVDLVGAYKADMREADDDLMRKARIFVDCRATTIGHIGEIMIPLRSGVITLTDIRADLYDLADGAPGRTTAEEITLYKNGGGAHLDLMTARYLMTLCGAGQ